MVGDPAQLPPVESTPPLQAIVRRYGAPVLKEICRQEETWHRRRPSCSPMESRPGFGHVCRTQSSHGPRQYGRSRSPGLPRLDRRGFAKSGTCP